MTYSRILSIILIHQTLSYIRLSTSHSWRSISRMVDCINFILDQIYIEINALPLFRLPKLSFRAKKTRYLQKQIFMSIDPQYLD